ncbi:MAG TPA: hypothetical protein DCQ06_14630 [Myxococcales bacterium]|nr:hypothetical protein [Myxococcales bacterium]
MTSIMWLLLCAFPAAVLVAINPLRRAPAKAQRWLLCIAIVGLGLRLLVAGRWVMYYTGYALFDDAVRGLSHSKYGPSTYALHHAVQSITGPSMELYLMTHRVLASLCPILMAALARGCGLSWSSTIVAAGLTATTPLLVMDAATESQLVVVTIWLLTAAALISAIALHPKQRTLRLSLAGAMLCLAIWGRPEMAVMAPVVMAITARSSALPRRFTAVIVSLSIALVALRLWSLSVEMDTQSQLGNTPKVFEVGGLTLAMTLLRDGLIHKSLIWRWDWLPALLPLAAFGVGKRRVAWWWIVVLLGSSLATIDMPWLSLPRLHSPTVMWLCLLAGAAFQGSSLKNSRSKTVMMASFWVLSCLVTLPALSARHLDDDEHDLIVAALQNTRPGDVIGRRSWSDAPEERLHLHFPDTAFAPRTRVVDLQTLSERAAHGAGSGRYLALLGTRCSMRRCSSTKLHPSCATIRARFELKALWEREVQAPETHLPWPFGSEHKALPDDQVRDLDFPWCLSASTFRVGLYELRGLRGR